MIFLYLWDPIKYLIHNSLPKKENDRKFNLYLKCRVKYAIYCIFGFSWMILRSLCTARNKHMFWREAKRQCMLFFFGSLWVLSRHWKHNVVGYKRFCLLPILLCFIFYFFFFQPGRIRAVGIVGIERKLEEKRKETDKNISEVTVKFWLCIYSSHLCLFF